MSMSQGEAVYQAVCNVKKYTPAQCHEHQVVLSKDERASVRQVLYEGFKAGKIVLNQDYDDKELMNYIPGLISNWLRKDKRLNGGNKYEPTNPGSRAGHGDPKVVAMRLLLASKTDASERAEIQSFIDARVAELKPAKQQLTAEQVEQLKAMGLSHLI